VARTRLRWLGFAPLYDGVWISPRDASDAAARTLAELGVPSYTVFTARVVPDVPQGVVPLDAWDLDDLRGRYESFVTERAELLGRTREGTVSAAEALPARTAVMDTWRQFPNLDPELPAELLPDDWPRGRARAVFAELYDSLGPLAEVRVRQLVAAASPELARLVGHHTTASQLGVT
jgi:phenylacetic acid degradation operon negative regulatory protein